MLYDYSQMPKLTLKKNTPTHPMAFSISLKGLQLRIFLPERALMESHILIHPKGQAETPLHGSVLSCSSCLLLSAKPTLTRYAELTQHLPTFSKPSTLDVSS